jgi:hypothetical protein
MFGLVGAVGAAEHVGVGTKFRPPLEDRRQPAARVEGNAAVLLVLRRRAWDADLAGVPVHALVLNHQHLAAATAEFQGADDAVVQECTHILVP